MARNVAYLGIRKHNGEQHAGSWPALTDPETFAAAGRVLTEPDRLKAGRHATVGRFKNLLTYIATCSKCKETVRAFKDVYGCPGGHVWIKRAAVDDLISELVILRLASPDLYAALEHAGDAADATLKAARSEAAALRQRLDGFREKAIEGEIEPESFAVIESGLKAKIQAAEAREAAARVPADLAGWVGAEEDVQARWAAATVGARRIVLRALGLGVEIAPANGKRGIPVHERVNAFWVN